MIKKNILQYVNKTILFVLAMMCGIPFAMGIWMFFYKINAIFALAWLVVMILLLICLSHKDK